MTHNLTKYIHRMSGEEGADVKGELVMRDVDWEELEISPNTLYMQLNINPSRALQWNLSI